MTPPEMTATLLRRTPTVPPIIVLKRTPILKRGFGTCIEEESATTSTVDSHGSQNRTELCRFSRQDIPRLGHQIYSFRLPVKKSYFQPAMVFYRSVSLLSKLRPRSVFSIPSASSRPSLMLYDIRSQLKGLIPEQQIAEHDIMVMQSIINVAKSSLSADGSRSMSM
ncbi:hypothetical protein CASFOL_042895 [Castilleja foliolosa]|uniref:Uncharacterized protein n=1 Tax=Castilleja foliolosa TaxID=1961234 RepID=A0ABD3B7G0_9LAMI